ncbi:MAG: hypothetical protein AAF805_00625 [Planctomycetota bacterium]
MISLRYGPRALLPVLATIVLAGGVSVTHRTARAFNGPQDRLPPVTAAAAQLAYSPQTGLAIDLDGLWFNEHGYRPIVVRVTAAAPRPIDRVVEIELSLAAASARGLRSAPASVVRRVATLAAGATKLDLAIPCPPGNWAFLWWETRVDGRADPSLSVSRGAARSIGGGQSGLVNVLRDASPAADRRRGTTLLYQGLGLRVDEITAPLPTDPVAYTGADIVRVSWPQLQGIVKRRPEVITALRSWTLAGGSFWVELCGDDEATLAGIDAALGIERVRFRATRAERDADPTPQPPGRVSEVSDTDPETEPSPAEAEALRAPTPIPEHPGWVYPKLRLGDGDGEADGAAAEATDSRGWFAERDAGFGRVVAFPRRFIDVPIRLAIVGPRAASQRWLERAWGARHGIAVGGMSSEFGNLLAEGVGVAPVAEFQVLITLFVLVIGPLNFWLLWRRRQRHLLVLTAPLVAGMATVGLFAYALMSDGFGVVERVRSVTLLDQRSGESAWWARATHHGGAAQRRPAAVPPGVAAYPIRPVWESAVAGATGSLATEVAADGVRRHTAAWLPSRSAVQHLLVGHQRFTGELVFRSAAADSPSADRDSEDVDPAAPVWSVSNRLGAELALLLVRADAGWMAAEALAAGAVAELEPIDRLDATQRLRVATVDEEPMFPVGAGFSVEQTLERLGNRSALRRLQGAVAPVSLAENLLNQRIGAVSGLDGGRPLDLPPRSYVAITPEGVTVPMLVEGAQRRDGFHMIVGRW